MNLHLMTTTFSYSRLLKLGAIFPTPKEGPVALSLVIELFIVIEKAAMTGCFKIIWRIIQHTALTYSVEGT